jgi:trigger factor
MVNVQTEHLENHTAKLTVEVEPERVEKALRQTARKIAKKARIPGFRPGKAPYNVIVTMFGMDYVLNEALGGIADDIYKEALEAADIEPYAPGSLEDIHEQGTQLVFTVPKRPEVELGEYRTIRVEFEEPDVTDEMVNEAMETLLEGQAVIEDVQRPAHMDDQVEIGHLYVGMLLTEEEIAEQEAAKAEAKAGEGEGEEEYDVVTPGEEDAAEEAEADAANEQPERPIFHQHDLVRVLREDEKDLLPGFSAEIVDAQAGDELEFYLDIPADFEDENLAGRRVRVEIMINKVQARTVPEWSDTLAARISDNQFETMLQLRMDVRKQLEARAQSLSDREVAEEALEKLIEGATFHYPDELVEDYLDDMIKDLERNVLAQQGLNLEHYLKLVEQTEEEFRASTRPKAIERAQRALALGEIVKQEQLESTDDDVNAEIEAMIESMGGEEAAGQFRSFFDTDQSRWNISNQLASSRATDRLVAIAKGQEPPVGVQRDEKESEEEADEANDADESGAEPIAENDTTDDDAAAESAADDTSDTEETEAEDAGSPADDDEDEAASDPETEAQE